MRDRMKNKTYIAIDLKSYYASAECAARGLDPMTTNLVVADESRTEKTICLAVSPSLKAQGVPGRPRLFEVIQKVREINAIRLRRAISLGRAVMKDGRPSLAGPSSDAEALAADPSLELSFIIAPPRMAYYMKLSADIFDIYQKYISSDDTLVYSIDEVFLDATSYMGLYKMPARDLTMTIVRDVLSSTGITATAGIGSNMYLAKLAMDIVAKHMPADSDGVRIAELDEESFRYKLWDHRPLTDFWMTGPATARRLGRMGISTMGELARFSIQGEDALFREFGVNAEIMIDHAWGLEPCGMKEIKAYKPSANSLSEGQVLARPYKYKEARIIIEEMADSLVWMLTDKRLVTESITIDAGYDRENVDKGSYRGKTRTDRYGRRVPASAHGSTRLSSPTNLGSVIIPACVDLFDRIADHDLTVRRVTITANKVTEDTGEYQLSLFTDSEDAEKEKKLQEAALALKKKYGKNAVLRGTNLLEGATMRERNKQVGGHKAE